MTRILNVGGRQGRGNTYATRRKVKADERPAVDALSLIVGAHVLDATPWVLPDPFAARYTMVMGVRRLIRDRMRRLRVRAAMASGMRGLLTA